MAASFNNPSSASEVLDQAPSSLLVSISVILSMLIVVSAAINLICFVLFMKNRELLVSPSNKFVFNFIIFSLATSVTLMPTMLGSLIAKKWIFGNMLCHTISILSIGLPLVGLLTLGGISFDRYHFICNPLTYPMNMTSFKVNVIIFFIWFTSIVSALMPLFGWGTYGYNPSCMTCTVQWNDSQSFGLYFVLMAYLFPLLLQAFCYANIIKVARKQAKFGRRMSRVAMLPMQVARIIRETSASKTIRKTCIVMGVFLVTWTPMVLVLLVLAFYKKSTVLTSFALTTNLLSFVSSLVYPLLFVFRSRNLKNEVKLLLGRSNFFVCMNQVEPEQLAFPEDKGRRKSSFSLEGYDFAARRRSSKVSRVSWAMPMVIEDGIEASAEPRSSLTASTITTDIGSMNLGALLPGEMDYNNGHGQLKLKPKILRV